MWEYLKQDTSTLDKVEWLNNLGKQGWELVLIYTPLDKPNMYTIIFKRKLKKL